MKVLPIQQPTYTKTNNKTSFKGVNLDAAMKQVGVPSNLSQYRSALNKLYNAVGKESSLNVRMPNVYAGLKEGVKTSDDFVLFIFNGIMKEPYGTRAVIAQDSTGPILSLAKSGEGGFVEFNGSQTTMRFGLTDVIGDKRYSFFKTPEVYVDYHDTFGTPAGGIRKFQTALGDAEYYDRNGNREYFGGLKGLFSSIFG